MRLYKLHMVCPILTVVLPLSPLALHNKEHTGSQGTKSVTMHAARLLLCDPNNATCLGRLCSSRGVCRVHVINIDC